MVLAELYFNALDHGLLGLDSALKETPDGFCEYYSERSKRLADLQEGKIQVSLSHERFGEGGRLQIGVEDTGSGFDVETSTFELEENASKSGRGLVLVRTLTRERVYSKGGTRAEASLVWGNAEGDS
ncbi:MAG: ATP-binding protein [Myxococcota bacterium]|jgi:hypothetical protein|nr:ATP-binding protein [Myxococcota bacterium]